jgi:DNA transformation protein and related proteins
MATDPSYLDFVLEQLSSVLPAINFRPMFGGVGIYTHGLFFALIASDTLYFYTDASNQADFLALDMQAFGRHYHQVPIGVLEDNEELRQWAEKSVNAAAKKRRKAPTRAKKHPDQTH